MQKLTSVRILAFAIFIFVATATMAQAAAAKKRLVSLDGSVTEILFALGLGNEIVGRDITSTYPPEAAKIPQIGQGHHFGAENILSLKPDLIFIPDDIRSPEIVEQLRNAKAKVVIFSAKGSVEDAQKKIRTVAEAVGSVKAGEALIENMNQDLATLQQRKSEMKGKDPLKAAFLYSRGPQSTFICGQGSKPAAMLTLAGAQDAAKGVENCKPMNAESLISMKPDVLVLFKDGLSSVGDIDGLMKLPGVEQTPAGKNRRFVVLDDLYLGGFGPRLGKAGLELFQGMYEAKGVYIAG